MPLPSSGQISINDIRNEIGTSDGRLRTLSRDAGFSSPDAMSEFYGYDAYSLYAFSWQPAGPCNYEYYSVYIRANGFYYGTLDNITYTLLYSLSSNWFQLVGYNPFFMANIYDQYEVDSTSTEITYLGQFFSEC
jgi:hypothetical protein